MNRSAFLDVTHSITGRHWVGPDIAGERLAEAIAQGTGLPMALCQTLAVRQVEPDQANAFLNPVLRDLLPDPLTLRDMD